MLVSDAAFLAREKARADAEYYTAAKFAEANMVRIVEAPSLTPRFNNNHLTLSQ